MICKLESMEVLGGALGLGRGFGFGLGVTVGILFGIF
jgi:hypothetical protein